MTTVPFRLWSLIAIAGSNGLALTVTSLTIPVMSSIHLPLIFSANHTLRLARRYALLADCSLG